jgi:PPOX class probable F420-dependent enzyme
MPNQRADIAMTPDEISEFLAAPRNLILVTNGPDGYPDPVAMWYVPAPDGSLWMRTYAKSQKVTNLRRDPRAAVLIETGSHYVELRGVQVTGRIELVDDLDIICDVFADLMIRYEGMEAKLREQARAGYLAKAAKQVAMHVVAETVVSWDHAKQTGGN